MNVPAGLPCQSRANPVVGSVEKVILTWFLLFQTLSCPKIGGRGQANDFVVGISLVKKQIGVREARRQNEKGGTKSNT